MQGLLVGYFADQLSSSSIKSLAQIAGIYLDQLRDLLKLFPPPSFYIL